MSVLTIFSETTAQQPEKVLRDKQSIAATLATVGVFFEQWQADKPLSLDAGQEEILQAYQKDILRLKQMGGYQTVDVIRMHPQHPDKAALRQKFLEEHTHSEDEVRFFVEGQAIFYMRLQGKIYALLCTAGDLVSVPAGTRHWFDMGDQPYFAAIRLFNNQEGWIAKYTGDAIAQKFPRYEALAANVAV